MGMSIDEAINILSYEGLDSSKGCGASYEDIDNALGVAIDTMRKYQKIQEIVARWKVDTWTDGVSYDCMTQISEVVEDGRT